MKTQTETFILEFTHIGDIFSFHLINKLNKLNKITKDYLEMVTVFVPT